MRYFILMEKRISGEAFLKAAGKTREEMLRYWHDVPGKLEKLTTEDKAP